MRRAVRRHANSDARCAIKEEEREARGEDLGLALRPVEIVRKIYSVHVDVEEQRVTRECAEATFSVPHCRRGVWVDGSKVSVSVDEWYAHGKVLCHPHQCIVHRRVAVRMVLAKNLADDPSALAVGRIRL
jgi:hypothetical protein